MKKILVVDDAPIIRELLIMIFEESGFKIAGEAENGLEAVSKYKKLKPDFVTMDLMMPKMNGIDAVKVIMEIDPDCNILVISAVGNEEMVHEAIMAGAKGFIDKPFSEEKVIAMTNKILGL